MRLLFLNHNTAYRGTFYRSHQLGRELAGRGHDVTLVTTSRSARLRGGWRDIDGVRVFEAPDMLFGPGRTGWDPWNIANRWLALRNRPYDLIHAFDSRPAVILPALALRRRTGAPLVMDWADWWGRGGRIRERPGRLVRALVGPLETWFEEAFRLRADGWTVISSALAERLARLGAPRSEILRVPNGTDAANIVPGDRSAARSRLGVAADTPVLLHIGVLTPGDEALLLNAFARARRDLPAARLVLVGWGAPGEGPAGVRRTGFVSFAELKDWLAAADLCVIPLRDTVGNRGRWPGKVNDHLAAGRPTLMTRVGDAPGYLEESGAGWAVAAEAEPLGAAMAARVASPGGLKEAGERARELAEAGLSWPEIADRVEQTYERVSWRVRSGSS